MKLIKNESYQPKERIFFKKHAHLLDKYSEILKKLKRNPFDPFLKTHKLKVEFSEFHVCSLTYEYRIVCVIVIQDDVITLVDIGTHDEVY